MRSLAESLFWEIFYRREAVRGELAQLLHVSAATISRAVSVLLATNLVVETSAPAGPRGRRPTLLGINPKLAYVGGIEMDRDRITAVVTDLEGNLLGRGAVSAVPGNRVDDTIRRTAQALKIALKDARLSAGKLARIGLGHTGVLDVERGLCLDWEGAEHWRGVPLAENLRESLGAEITLDDRARAVALALHLTWAEGRRHRIAIYVQIGTGIGSGIFVNGRLLRGASQTGGELGHMTIKTKWSGMRVRQARMRRSIRLFGSNFGARTRRHRARRKDVAERPREAACATYCG
jgi:predicted NBD/HSP70 family sugar kinase